MKKENFDLWMNAVDNSLLEEAAVPPSPIKKITNYRPFAMVAAACFILAVTGLLLRQGLLPGTQPNITPPVTETVTPTKEPQETITPAPDNSIKKEMFEKNGTDYTLLSCEAAEPTDLSGMDGEKTEELSWNANGLNILLCSTSDAIWASWYDTSSSTQWCLLSDTSSLALLTTARELVEELGYNVAVAPKEAADITYNAFRINELAVAETTFLLDGVRYSYRMAATYEIAEDFADISGTGELYSIHSAAEVGWCPARIYYDENGYGKIIWFDIAPGLLYSLSMETNASENALLTLASELFSPAQGEAGQ